MILLNLTADKYTYSSDKELNLVKNGQAILHKNYNYF